MRCVAIIRVSEVKIKTCALALGNWNQGILFTAVLACGVHLIFAALTLLAGFEGDAKLSVTNGLTKVATYRAG